jgi:hypothetical protein
MDDRRCPEKDLPKAAITLAQNIDSLTFGANYRDGFTFDAVARCGGKTAAARVVSATKKLLSSAQEKIEKSTEPNESEMTPVAKDLIRAFRVDQEENVVRGHTAVHGGFGKLIKEYLTWKQGE